MPRTSAVVVRIYQVVAAIALASFLSCVRTEHPLSEVGKVVVDPELVGEWKLYDDSSPGYFPVITVYGIMDLA